MKPIDGEKLYEWILTFYPELNLDDSRSELIDEFCEKKKNGDFNLPPGTLIIQREEGYEDRFCEDCIQYGNNCAVDRYFKSKHPDVIPCKYNITEDELKNAIIVGDCE